MTTAYDMHQTGYALAKLVRDKFGLNLGTYGLRMDAARMEPTA
jgi:hypothetical protein